MRNSRRLAMVASAVIATGALIAGSAGGAAAETSSFEATARADALTISVFGTTLTTSAATARLTEDTAKATATETLLQPMSDLVVEQSGPGEQSQAPEKCEGSDLTAIPVINRLDLTCGSVAVKIGQSSFARGIGSQVVLEPSVANLLGTLQLQEPVQGAVDQIFEEAIDPLVKNLTGNPVGDLVDATTATVQDVLNDVLQLQATARIVIAPVLAEATSENGIVTSHARAQGIRIELLPPTAEAITNGLFPDVAPNEPLLTITVGEAEATKVLGDAAKSSATAALVHIHLASTQLTEALGLAETTDIKVEGGQSFCILPEPLTTCVQVAAAQVDGEGNANADGASIQLFKGVNGGIDIATGRASTGGNLVAATIDIPQELPRTGGPATLPIIGGGLLALAAGTRRLSQRRR